MTINVSKFYHGTGEKSYFNNLSPPVMNSSSGFLLVLGLLFDITPVIITLFYVNKYLKADYVPILVKMLREDCDSKQIIPEWETKETKEKPITSYTDFSSKAYFTAAVQPKNLKSVHQSSDKRISSTAKIKSLSFPMAGESQDVTLLTNITSTNICNTSDVHRSQKSLFSANDRGSSRRSSVRRKYDFLKQNKSNQLSQKRRQRLCTNKKVPEVIKNWLNEREGDGRPPDVGSKGLVVERPKHQSKSHPFPRQESHSSKATVTNCIDILESGDPLGIERMNSHDKVRNYLCDLTVDKNTSMLQNSMDKDTLKNSVICSISREVDFISESERREINTERLSEFEFRSSAGDTFSSIRGSLRQSKEVLNKQKFRRKTSTPNMKHSPLNPRFAAHRSRIKINKDEIPYDNTSMTDSISFRMPLCNRVPSTSDLTNISVETETNVHVGQKNTTKDLKSPKRGNYEKQNFNVPKKRNRLRKFSYAPQESNAISSGVRKSRNKFGYSQRQPQDDHFPQNSWKSSSDSLSSETTTIKKKRSPEKFASETNSLWHLMMEE